ETHLRRRDERGSEDRRAAAGPHGLARVSEARVRPRAAAPRDRPRLRLERGGGARRARGRRRQVADVVALREGARRVRRRVEAARRPLTALSERRGRGSTFTNSTVPGPLRGLSHHVDPVPVVHLTPNSSALAHPGAGCGCGSAWTRVVSPGSGPPTTDAAVISRRATNVAARTGQSG